MRPRNIPAANTAHSPARKRQKRCQIIRSEPSHALSSNQRDIPRARRYHQAQAIRCNIDPSCIACAVFFLLIIFMLQPPPPHGALSLPRVANAAPVPTAAKDDSLYVFILRDGTAFFRGAKLSPIDLHPKLREALSESSKRRVYLSVDVRARYRAVKQVLDEISAAGIQSVCFLGNRPTTPPMLQSPHD